MLLALMNFRLKWCAQVAKKNQDETKMEGLIIVYIEIKAHIN